LNSIPYQTTPSQKSNNALKFLLKRREEDKTEIEEKVLFSVKELVGPHLEKLKRSKLDRMQKAHVDIIESNLNMALHLFPAIPPSY